MKLSKLDIAIGTIAVLLIGGYFAQVKFGLVEKVFNKIPGGSGTLCCISNAEDWKTYKNDKHGFEFKYPENWVVLENEAGTILTLGTEDTIQEGGFFAVIVKNQTKDDFISSLNENGFNIINKNETNFGNQKGIFLTYKRSDTSNDTWNEIITEKDGQLIEFSRGATPYYEDIFNGILPTFKFTK